MRKKWALLAIILFLAAVAILALVVRGHTVSIMQPQGHIAAEQKRLIIIAVGLSMIVVVPVFVMAAVISWKYRASNKKAQYRPDWAHSRLAETVWWGVPTLIIFILSIITWRSAHTLDPYRALKSSKQPLTVQVVALQWKWLFIYPDQKIASVNEAHIPVGTPVDFEITSDAPMNSFWVPQLAGQIYAMSGMSTHLHVVADKAGNYKGGSANISGEGFSGMNFTVRATDDTSFNSWVSSVKTANNILSQSVYNTVALPSKDAPVTYYSSVQDSLYDTIVAKYMTPTTTSGTANDMQMEGTMHHSDSMNGMRM